MIALVIVVVFGGLLVTFLVGWAIAEICLHDEAPGPGAGR
jgi:hypothetical protein